MDVRCKLLGHVRGSTEFEERHENRSRGTVLICREYQVCRRCGDHEEMYRNEQVLSPEAAKVDVDPEEGSTDSEHSDDGAIQEAATTGTDASGSDEPRTEITDGDSVDIGESPGDAARDPDDAGQVTDDGVILSGSSAEPDSAAGSRHKQPVADGMGPASDHQSTDDRPTSLFDAENGAGGQLCCDNCGREWERDATSLREGDICPECRRAYVQEA